MNKEGIQNSCSKDLKSNKDVISQNIPKCELAIVVLQAGERNDVRYLYDYLQMTKLSGELNINEQDSRGCSPLHYAVSSLNISIVQCLVEYSAFSNLQDNDGYTPLIWACAATAAENNVSCSKKSTEIAAYLIEKVRASIHIETKAGQTPLHVASASGNLECVKLLLKHGADLKKLDHEKRSVFDLTTDPVVKNYLLSIMTSKEQHYDDKYNFCSECGKKANEVTLKRCANCFAIKYCGKSCQIKHWKAIHRKKCAGSILCKQELITFNNSNIFDKNKELSKDKLVIEKKDCKFIVKVQLPLVDQNINSGMYVYNVDRSISGFIVASQLGYNTIKELIIDEGYMGMKAFFWACLDDKENVSIRVFHAQCAPYQEW